MNKNFLYPIKHIFTSELNDIVVANKNANSKLIFVYHNDYESILSAHTLYKNNVSFAVYNNENAFFQNETYVLIRNTLALSVDPSSTKAFRSICYDMDLYFTKELVNEIVNLCQQCNLTIYQSADNIINKLNRRKLENWRRFEAEMQKISSSTSTFEKLNRVLQLPPFFSGKKSNASVEKGLIEIAKCIPNVSDFRYYLDELQDIFSKPYQYDLQNDCILTNERNIEQLNHLLSCSSEAKLDLSFYCLQV